MFATRSRECIPYHVSELDVPIALEVVDEAVVVGREDGATLGALCQFVYDCGGYGGAIVGGRPSPCRAESIVLNGTFRMSIFHHRMILYIYNIEMVYYQIL